jgi:hypothetical protein
MTKIVPAVILAFLGGLFVAYQHDPFIWNGVWAAFIGATLLWYNRTYFGLVPSPTVATWYRLLTGFVRWLSLSSSAFILQVAVFSFAHYFIWPD